MRFVAVKGDCCPRNEVRFKRRQAASPTWVTYSHLGWGGAKVRLLRWCRDGSRAPSLAVFQLPGEEPEPVVGPDCLEGA